MEISLRILHGKASHLECHFKKVFYFKQGIWHSRDTTPVFLLEILERENLAKILVTQKVATIQGLGGVK